MNDRVKQATEKLLELFASEQLPPAMARTVIRSIAADKVPADSWSLNNRLLLLMSETSDARGYRQWQQVGRQVKKGAKALYILAPVVRNVAITETEPKTGEEVKTTKPLIVGWKTIPVFAYEDTEGEPLPERASYEPGQLPPLYEVARKFGTVSYKPLQGQALGTTNTRTGGITLYTHDVDVFFHELAHSVHRTIRPLQGGQHVDQEVIAEMTACVLCELYGITGYQWQGWEYIKHYAGDKALQMVNSVLSEVEAIVAKILATEAQLSAA